MARPILRPAKEPPLPKIQHPAGHPHSLRPDRGFVVRSRTLGSQPYQDHAGRQKTACSCRTASGGGLPFSLSSLVGAEEGREQDELETTRQERFVMNVRHQRGVCLAAILGAVFSLTACGGPDVGVSDEEILIGTWAPLTGQLSYLADVTKGMEAYFQHVNDQGGIHGRKLRLIVKDDQYDPAQTPEVVKGLIEQDHVFGILGGTGTESCLAVKEYLANKFIPWVNPGSASRMMTTPTQASIFSVLPTNLTEGRILARHAVEDFKAEKVGLFYQDDPFGREGLEGVDLGLGDVKKKIRVAVPHGISEDDFSTHAQKFKDAEVDTVIFLANPVKAALLLGEFEKLDFHPKLLGTEILADSLMFELAGEMWEGAVVATGVPDPNSDEPGVVLAREILAKYGSGESLGTFTLMGISWAQLLAEGLRETGEDLTRIRLIYALENLTYSENVLGVTYEFTPESHHGFDSVRLMKAEEGQYVYLTDWIQS